MADFNELWNRLHKEHGLAAIVGPGNWTAENYSKSGAFTAERVRAIHDYRGKAVLDYGCGDGRVAEHVLPLTGALHLADASADVLERAKKRVPGAAGYHRVEWPQTLATTMQGAFDCIYSSAVLYHLTDVECMHVLSGFHALLKPGGVAVFDFCDALCDHYISLLRLKAEKMDWKDPWPWVAQDSGTLIQYATKVAGFSKAEVIYPTIPQPWIRATK